MTGVEFPDGMIRTGAGDCDRCEFNEVELGDEVGDLIPAGTKVLLPCSRCGVTGLEVLNDTEHARYENEKAFARYVADQFTTLFHWAPVARRKQIIRHGLRPRMRPTTHSLKGWRAGYVCFADTPRWAWNLSAGMRHAPVGDYDLWVTSMGQLKEPLILPTDWSNGIHEVRTEHRVYKSALWHAGTRTKESRP